jgi:hypothetical protein
MKNITLSVPDDVYRKARLAAARQDTSVSALVADFLLEIASGRSRHASRTAAIAKAFDAITDFRASDRLTREQLNDRTFMRQLEQRHRQLHSDTPAQ